MIDLNTKKDILIILGNAETEVSKITKDYCVYSQENEWIRHLLCSIGYLRDSMRTLSKEIIEESKVVIKK